MTKDGPFRISPPCPYSTYANYSTFVLINQDNYPVLRTQVWTIFKITVIAESNAVFIGGLGGHLPACTIFVRHACLPAVIISGIFLCGLPACCDLQWHFFMRLACLL
jgi:hypothetical protein